MNSLNAYLDTCIISGLVKQDLKQEQQTAMLKLLEYRKNDIISIVTSKVAKVEIEKIPKEYRYQHLLIYRLIADVPICKTFSIHSRGLMGMGMGLGMGSGSRRLNQIYKSLKELLPDEQDANHIYQASKNKVKYFLTADEQTILIFSEKIFKICDVIAISPVEFFKIVTNCS